MNQNHQLTSDILAACTAGAPMPAAALRATAGSQRRGHRGSHVHDVAFPHGPGQHGHDDLGSRRVREMSR